MKPQIIKYFKNFSLFKLLCFLIIINILFLIADVVIHAGEGSVGWAFLIAPLWIITALFFLISDNLLFYIIKNKVFIHLIEILLTTIIFICFRYFWGVTIIDMGEVLCGEIIYFYLYMIG